MKISPQHYAILRDAIAPLAPKLSAHRDFVTKEGKAKDIEMRVRWDALHAVKIDGKPSCVWICAELYPLGVNDTHIDTALRAIMREIGFAQ